MPSNKDIDIGICRTGRRHNGTIWSKDTGSGSAIFQLYAIGTGATGALHARNFLQEAMNTAKVMTRIHTDSASGKSVATRIRSSKKAEHIELRHLSVKQVV